MITSMSRRSTHGFGIEGSGKEQSRFWLRRSSSKWVIHGRRRAASLRSSLKLVVATRASTSETGETLKSSSAEQDSVEGLGRDESFMRAAMEEARRAYNAGEVPVGAVLVHKGAIIARAHNRVEAERDPTAHAEMLCIRQAARILGGWRLIDSALYVTLEPCPMCAGAILQARVGEIVWGARNTHLGADGSWISLFPGDSLGTNCEEDCVRKGRRTPLHPFHPDLVVRRGVLAAPCSELMKSFFKMRRTSKQKPSPVWTKSLWLKLQSSTTVLSSHFSHLTMRLAESLKKDCS